MARLRLAHVEGCLIGSGDLARAGLTKSRQGEWHYSGPAGWGPKDVRRSGRGPYWEGPVTARFAATLISRAKKEGRARALLARPAAILGDSTSMKKFSPAQLAALSSAYGGLNRVDPSQPTYRALTALLDKLPCANLKQLVQADIKFVSGLARNRVVRKNCKVG